MFPVSIQIDMNDLRSYTHKLERVTSAAKKELEGVVSKGALKIKEDMQAELRRSGTAGFRYVAETVSYDLIDSGMTAEIGPSAGRGKGKGTLANIAYFGSWKGGGTREDPYYAAQREIPHFEEHVNRIVEGLF